MNVTRPLLNMLAVWREAVYYIFGNLRAGLHGVRVGAGARISPYAKLTGVYSIGCVTIGRDVTLGKGSYVSSGQVMAARIGAWCSIGYDVLIGPSEHDPDAVTTSPTRARALGLPLGAADRAVEAPVIEDEVWIGARVVVLRGVRIGRGAVIAAGAVVTGDVPPGEVWGGVPARFIRRRTDPANNLSPTAVET